MRGLPCEALISDDREFGDFSQVVSGVVVGEFVSKISRSCREGDEGSVSRSVFKVSGSRFNVVGAAFVEAASSWVRARRVERVWEMAARWSCAGGRRPWDSARWRKPRRRSETRWRTSSSDGCEGGGALSPASSF